MLDRRAYHKDQRRKKEVSSFFPDAARVPVLTTFDLNKMIQFHDGIGPITRERHAPGSEKPSCIQAKKESSVLRNSRQLPKFKVILLFIFILFFYS